MIIEYNNINRRNFFKLSTIGAGIFASIGHSSQGNVLTGSLELTQGGIDYSPVTKMKRKAIPTACWQCVNRCNIIGYVEDEILVKIEGNPKSIRNRGKICSKGQAGINQVYDPDRVLYPMKRVGKRGEGKWKRISWDEALDEVTSRLKKLRDSGHPEKFMFHYGRMKGSDSKIIKSNFLPAYGTKTIGNHTTICEAAKWTAQELTMGKHYDVPDVEHANMVLVFGSNPFEAHTAHLQIATRLANAVSENNVKLVTFDVRLSNTAARSTQWIPIKPGTDLAVILAMANTVMQNNLYDQAFIESWTNVSVDQLKSHLKKYTPLWAEKISGVDAKTIESLALEYAKAKPGTIISYRGAVAHYNGVETERAAKMLDGVCGYIDIKGGTCLAVGPKWKSPSISGHPKGLKISDGLKGDAVLPTHHISHRVLSAIKDGSNGRPDVYMTYCYAPVYANGDVKENIAILKDEKLIPYYVNINPFYDESAALADLILPDVTYLERWSWDDMISFAQIPVHYIRQPVVKPLGESRQFQDVAIEIAKRLGIDLGFESTVDFIKKSCEMSGFDFEYLKKHGLWHPENAKPRYKSYAKKLSQGTYTGDDILFDESTGVYWNWKKTKAQTKEKAILQGYTATKYGYKGYVGQKIGDVVYAGFTPDKVNKSGRFELYSKILEAKGFPAMPSWMAIPEHEKMKEGELVLTTYKVATQIHSRSQNCKWLTEIYHDNPAWINPMTAESKGIKDGDKIKVKSSIGEIVTKARVTNSVHPGVISISHHCGHWEYGRYASNKKSPYSKRHEEDKFKWWQNNGVHPNWIIPNAPDPIAGQLRCNDTVVIVAKV